MGGDRAPTRDAPTESAGRVAAVGATLVVALVPLHSGGPGLDCGLRRSDGIPAAYPARPAIPYMLMLAILAPSIGEAEAVEGGVAEVEL